MRKREIITSISELNKIKDIHPEMYKSAFKCLQRVGFFKGCFVGDNVEYIIEISREPDFTEERRREREYIIKLIAKQFNLKVEKVRETVEQAVLECIEKQSLRYQSNINEKIIQQNKE